MTDLRERVGTIDRRQLFNTLGLLLLLVIVGLFLSVTFPQLVGADQSFVVQSSSMSPSISAGSIVYVNDVPANQIAQGDVITFQSSADTRTTHKVVEVVETGEERRFRTKGDANEEPDPDFIASGDVIGRVGFHVPLIGYVVSFAQTKVGLLLFVVVPAVLLLGMELRDLYLAGTDGENNPDNGRVIDRE